MTAQSPSAYTLSLLIHGGLVGLLLVGTLVLRDHSLLDKAAKPFELVAGEGDNYNATEAPALGTPTGVKIDIPPAPVVAPAEETPAPEPVTAAPMDAVTAPKEKPKPVDKVVKSTKPEQTIAQKMEKIASRREKRIVEKFRKDQERLAKQQELEAKRMSKEEFDKQNAARKAGGKPATSTTKGPRIDAEGIAKGVVGGSTKNKTGGAGGKALTREEQDALDSYFAYLKLKVKQAHETERPDNVADTMRAKVSFMCAANGAIGAVKIALSSGNADFDQSVLRAVRAVGSIGARPDGRSDTVILEINMKDDD